MIGAATHIASASYASVVIGAGVVGSDNWLSISVIMLLIDVACCMISRMRIVQVNIMALSIIPTCAVIASCLVDAWTSQTIAAASIAYLICWYTNAIIIIAVSASWILSLASRWYYRQS